MKCNRQILLPLIAGIVLTLPLLAGCASLERNAGANSDIAASTLTIQDVWARSDNAGHNSAAYLTITNDSDQDDRLIGAESEIADSTEIHEVISHDNVMKMQEIDEVSVPVGEAVSLEPGGDHVMLFDLTEDLVAGDEIEITLMFDNAGTITVTAEVRDHTPDHDHGASRQGGA